MTTQPTALRLADLIDHGSDSTQIEQEVFDELRRLADIERRFYELQRHGVLRAVYEKVEAQRDALLEALKMARLMLIAHGETHAKINAAIKAVEENT